MDHVDLLTWHRSDDSADLACGSAVLDWILWICGPGVVPVDLLTWCGSCGSADLVLILSIC
jgi:hypothetical protein